MFPDLVLAVIVVLAIIKGYQRGLIIGIFSFVAVIVGLAAALKLSTIAAGYIGKTINVSDTWLPVISFAAVFIGVVLLVRLGANMLQKTVEWSMLGWVNRLGGILLYVAIFVIVYSVILFYAEQLHLIQAETIEKSVACSYISPWGPNVVEGIGSIIPAFKGMFAELQTFFAGMAEKIPEASAPQ